MKMMLALLAIGLVSALPAPLLAAATNDLKSVVAQTQSNAQTPAQTGNPLWVIPFEKLTDTRERPLFTPSRRQPPPTVAAPADSKPVRAPAKQTTPQLELIGTIIGAVEGFGLFVDPTTDALIRLKAGGEYQGWVLRSVRKREVVLTKEDLTVTLSLPRHDL